MTVVGGSVMISAHHSDLVKAQQVRSAPSSVRRATLDVEWVRVCYGPFLTRRLTPASCSVLWFAASREVGEDCSMRFPL